MLSCFMVVLGASSWVVEKSTKYIGKAFKALAIIPLWFAKKINRKMVGNIDPLTKSDDLRKEKNKKLEKLVEKQKKGKEKLEKIGEKIEKLKKQLNDLEKSKEGVEDFKFLDKIENEIVELKKKMDKWNCK